MGNCFSIGGNKITASKHNADDLPAVEDQVVSKKKQEEVPVEKPKPMVFALMRNGHEVIRGTVREVEDYLEAGDVEQAIMSYTNLMKWMNLHLRMEEGNRDGVTPMGFFAVLDQKFDNIATKEGLRDEHDDIDKLEQSMEEAVGTKDLEKIKQTFEAFKTANEDHLKKEESVMMKKVMEMKKNGENMKEIMIEELLATIIDDEEFPFFVKHANCILDKFDDGNPKARVFDHALWAVATPEQWQQWKLWIEESLPESRFKEVMAVIGN